MAEIPKFDLGNLKIEQLSFVYKDITKQAKIMEELYGIPKFAVMTDMSHPCTFRGKDVEVILDFAFSRLFNVQIELQQWKSGDSVFKEFLDQGKEGLHSVGLYVDDLQLHIDELKKKGIEVIQTGQIGKQWFAYFDTVDTFGILLEFQQTVKRRRKK
jgi:methylmalonyl-CoA/ethylmalonyl-CoA epimerase